MKQFKLPDLGEGLPDAEVVEWHVKEGDTVKVDDPLVSMETAKAVVEVPSPYEGKILKLNGKPGDVIDTGSVLVEFEGEEINDTGTVAGKIEVGDTVVTEAAISVSKHMTGVKATPAVRALAQRLSVDLTHLTPTGPNGTVTADDVKKANEALSSAGPLEPLRGVRRAMAQTMAQAHEEVVMVNVMDDADITDWAAGQDITARLVQAVVAGVAAEPALNAWYESKSMGRRLLSSVDLGLAMDTEDGLFVPVIKDAGSLSSDALRDAIDTYKTQVMKRAVAPEALRNPSITLSNFGKFAGRYATPVVVPPTVAIIGAGRLREEVKVVDGEMKIRKVIPLSITFDHRAVTGGEATRFLGAIIESLAQTSL